MTPRDYQLDAVKSFFDYWSKYNGNPLCCMPTGTGKSIVIAEFIRQALRQYPHTRILVLTHVKELISQNFEKLLEIWPTAPAGIFSAGLGRKDISNQVTFAGIGSVVKNPQFFKPDLIFIDEAHTVSPKESTSYRKAISYWQTKNKFLKVGGLTATPFRLGQGELIEEGGLFSDICFDITSRGEFNKLISQGYLCPVVPRPIQTEIDISEVKIAKTGDYNLSQLQSAVDKKEITQSAINEILSFGENRNHWLIFAAGIEHSNHIAETLCERGISALSIHSKCTKQERDEGLLKFKSGEIRAVVNNGCLTTGFDFPGIDLIACLRHTTSPGLWVQMLGRGTRPLWQADFDLSTIEGRLTCIASAKQNCLVLDFAKNASRLGPINDPVKPRAKSKDATPGDMPAKTCPACWTQNFTSARFCSYCKEEFIFKIKLSKQSSEDILLAENEINSEPVTEWFAVENVTYEKHTPWNAKIRGRWQSVPSSLRVGYNCGLRSFFEYVCIEHEGSALACAKKWWSESCDSIFPDTVSKSRECWEKFKQPTRIKVWTNRKNPQILYREFL